MDDRHYVPDEPTQPPAGGEGSIFNQAHDESVTPRDLKVRIAEQKLIIEWLDGRHSEYSLAELRRKCPCALCRAERVQTGDNPLEVLKTDPHGVRVTHAELVGSYAIKFRWSDGHDTGIFDFRLLRGLRQ